MGDDIFKNQPTFKTFKSNFDGEYDSLFYVLNELETFHNFNTNTEEEREYRILTDPRTKCEVAETYIDHTVKNNIKVFECLQRSSLKSDQHKACLRVLLAQRENMVVAEEDLAVWEQTKNIRENEKQQMLKFVCEQSQQNFNSIYKPMNYLIELYGQWYKKRIAHVIQHVPNETYQTILGMPHINLCKVLSDDSATIEHIELIEQSGYFKLNQHGNEIESLENMFTCLEHYVLLSANDYITESNAMKTYSNLQEHRLDLPLDSILFLLTAGDYIDLPTEILLEIHESTDTDYKAIYFHKPFPSNKCGWHTSSQLVENAFAAYMSKSRRAKWLYVSNGISKIEENDEFVPEFDAKYIDSRTYKPLTYDDYIAKTKQTGHIKDSNNVFKTNQVLVSWQLCSTNTTNHQLFKIYSTFQSSAFIDSTSTAAARTIASKHIKIEHKPEYGCEIMTKYELLKCWLQLKLLQTNYGECTRINVNGFSLVLQQQYTLAYIEEQLQQHYHINTSHLLGNLHSFLSLLIGVQPGKYLLRYYSKYPEKFLLCSPTQTPSQTAVHLHNHLLQASFNKKFLTPLPFLPIAHDLCGAMHLQHQLLPCAFPLNVRKKNANLLRSAHLKEVLVKERQCILKRVEKANSIKKKQTQKRKRTNKQKKKKEM